MNVKNKLRDLRLAKNITQEELAEALSVSRQTIISIEKGHYTPSLPLALQLADFFKTSVEKIFQIQ